MVGAVRLSSVVVGLTLSDIRVVLTTNNFLAFLQMKRDELATGIGITRYGCGVIPLRNEVILGR